MKLKHLVLLSTALIFSQQANAVGKGKADRWFEMEVILFSQLGDKAKLKEQFPAGSTLPEYRRVIDLLGPYLSPDISSLKQQLPNCSAPVYPQSLLNQAIEKVKSSPYYQLKSLVELKEESTISFAEIQEDASTSLFSDGTNTQEFSPRSETINHSQQADIEDDFYNNNRLATESANDISAHDIYVNEFDDISEVEQTNVLSEEQLAQQEYLLAQAEQEFSAIQFSYSNETASLTQQLCTISVEKFKQFNHKKTYDHYTGFAIQKVPATINNNEDIYSDNDYLISKESLKLHDIVKQLARSKNFKPLLHVGWRQKTKTKRFAVPVKMYAGDNFAYHYQQELKQFQQQLKQAQQQENALNQALFENNSDNLNDGYTPVSKESLKHQALTNRLQELIIEVANVPNDTESLLKKIDQDITTTQQYLHSEDMLAPPAKPPQDWMLEGMFKVEVDHFLHITADFNIMNMSLAQLATQQLLPENAKSEKKPLSIINFKQNRRVISKEIHYFDHPYIGMIVRILPYKKPVKETE